jgi:hypothetical protein
VLEYCAKSELHPAAAELGMLKGRKLAGLGKFCARQTEPGKSKAMTSIARNFTNQTAYQKGGSGYRKF